MLRIKYSTEGSQIKVVDTKLWRADPENDVLHDARKII
jgi:hypothetical protein